ncbi:MAG TPA: type II CAAX endopeptidase family protein [Desulfobaccales bacterium]|nr:type II CAAX endopeptidase family protein [Desulfobaccales bacterium]
MENGGFKPDPYWLRPGQTFWNYHLIEVLVFLFLIVPSMAMSFMVKSELSAIGFVSVATATIVRDLALVSLVFYFIWRNGESLRQLGWTWRNGWRDIFWGLFLFLPFTFSANLLDGFLKRSGLYGPSGAPSFLTVHATHEIALGVFLVIVVALAEETIFRGYLILRFRGAHLGSLAAAVLSSGIFCLGHGYEGAAGVVTVFYMGLIFALIYLWRGSLIAPVIMHFLQDFIGVVITGLIK